MSVRPDLSPPPKAIIPAKRRLASLRTIGALMLREMETTYGRSPGGYIWAIMDPVAGIILLTLVFSIAFRTPPLGESFPFFYATGMVPFVAYTSISGKIASAVNFSKPLLAYPSVTFADAILARFFLNVLTELLVAYCIFIGIMLIFDLRISADFTVLAVSFAMMASLSLGIGTLNCFLFAQFPTWQRSWGILMRPMFIISCIFFLFETIPQPYRDGLWYNPLVHMVGYMRHGFYPSYEAPYVSLLYVFGLSLVCFVAGFVLLSRYHRDIIND